MLVAADSGPSATVRRPDNRAPVAGWGGGEEGGRRQGPVGGGACTRQQGGGRRVGGREVGIGWGRQVERIGQSGITAVTAISTTHSGRAKADTMIPGEHGWTPWSHLPIS